MSIVWSRSIVVVFALLSVGFLYGQSQNFAINPKINSPFTRFGLGDPVDQFFSAAAGMGGLSAAFNDPYHLNLLNPASLAHLKATAFEVGLYAKYGNLKGTTESDAMWSGNLNYLALGFPLINPVNEALDRRNAPWDFGMGIALSPYTMVGYDIEADVSQPGVSTSSNLLKGTGGTYRLSWGNAVRYKKVSAGIQLGYMFGKITNNRRVEFDSLQFSYGTEFLNETSVSGWTWSAGVQYIYDFMKPDEQGVPKPTGKRLIIGGYGNSLNTISTNSRRFFQRDNIQYGDLDTILFEDDIEGDLTLPSQLSIGLTYEQINKLRLGVEYSLAGWSNYRNDARPQERLSDTWRVAVGGEYIPEILSYNNYFKRMRYRLGFYYSNDPRSIEGEQLKEYGLTFGFGFPIIMPRQQVSFVNLSFEAGQFGVDEVLQETFFKMTVGFTLNDNSWFFKRKFN